jgi:hypothetical protein
MGIMKNIIDKYDEYGRLKIEPWSDIKKGDRVGYKERRWVKEFGQDKKIKKIVQLFGYWDGEKVEFDDTEKTIVRTKRWLTNENVF